MKCDHVRENIHAFLDLQQGAREISEFETHLEQCQECSNLYAEYRALQEMMAVKLTLPEASARRILQEAERRSRYGFGSFFTSAWDMLYTYWRDLDRAIVWSRVGAIPVTLLFFTALLLQFSPIRIERMNFPVLSLEQWATSTLRQPQVATVQVRQNGAEIDDLMDTAWRLPYEDSLQLLAEITPDGHAEIENVLEYPKSVELLNAVDVSLRKSHFESSPEIRQPFVIISFQKIDVYENQRGL